MKKFLPFLSIALFAVACNSAPERTLSQSGQQTQSDTSGLSAFNEWKAQEAYLQMQEAEKTVLYTPVQKQAQTKAVKSSSSRSSSGSANRPADNSNDKIVLDNESADEAKAKEKKGWSKAAKGAVIGGVAGAAGGAAIHKKNRVVGAVVGAVIGAGGGYAVGRGMDKKDGRYLIQ
ncbi:MAG: glycine zipper domain-containing protein [Flavisolibacter sp.]